MIAPMKTQITLTFLALAASLHAGPRTSANYSIPAEAADSGGRRATSANFTNDGSVGLIVGLSAVASPAETAMQTKQDEEMKELRTENAALKQRLAKRDARDGERDARIARLEQMLPGAPAAQKASIEIAGAQTK